ncbi:MAG: helix-turn-helix domain-containing protein [Thermoplasmata archaeon]|nr:helix-turn-helix domain-containing protein [Candidatus Sysuiplasma acidicola]
MQSQPAIRMESVEATIELERDDCVVSNLIFERLKDANVSRLVIGHEKSLHRIKSDNLLEVITDLRHVSESVKKVGRDVLWVEGKSCSACRFLSTSNVPILSSRTIDNRHLAFRILVQSKKSLELLIAQMAKAGLNPRVIDMKAERPQSLTDREKEVLLFVFNHGYFESSRESSLTELAEKLGVSTSSLSDVMRRALRKTVEDYLRRNL